jgi:hypothetical protein
VEKNEEVRVDIVVDGVAFPLKGEEAIQAKKAILKRRLEENATVEQLGKRKKLSASPPQVIFTLIEGKDEEEIRREVEAFLEKRRRNKLNTTNDE